MQFRRGVGLSFRQRCRCSSFHGFFELRGRAGQLHDAQERGDLRIALGFGIGGLVQQPALNDAQIDLRFQRQAGGLGVGAMHHAIREILFDLGGSLSQDCFERWEFRGLDGAREQTHKQ